MKRPDDKVTSFDDDFESALVQWREKHRLREDDAVLLLVDLFRIHQQHWDELRRRELPSFEQFRSDITRLVETARAIQELATGLHERLQRGVTHVPAPTVTRTAAWLATLAGGLAGYLLGRAGA
ncbi:MAG: hypothetical protein J0M24_03445 [Verrucomicrobia bacterium]|nr:hypothetical protein [Verrucomicrobiota bacterium]